MLLMQKYLLDRRLFDFHSAEIGLLGRTAVVA